MSCLLYLVVYDTTFSFLFLTVICKKKMRPCNSALASALSEEKLEADALQQKLAAANADGDFGLSAAEVQDFLAAGGNQMIDLIAKFDTNMDGELDADEMASLNAYLKEEADKMPPRVNKLSQEGLGGHMMMTMFRKGRLQMKSERAEKKESPDQKLVRRCARADKKAAKILNRVEFIIEDDQRANAMLAQVAEQQRNVKAALIGMDPSLSVFFSQSLGEEEAEAAVPNKSPLV